MFPQRDKGAQTKAQCRAAMSTRRDTVSGWDYAERVRGPMTSPTKKHITDTTSSVG